MTEEGLLYLGSETIKYLSEYWKEAPDSRMSRAIGNGDMDEYLEDAFDKQKYRVKSERLDELAIRAESKPCIFNPELFKESDVVICFMQDEIDSPRGHLVEAVVTEVKYQQGGRPVYELLPYRPQASSTGEFEFSPDNVSIIQYKDKDYYRLYPNFLRTALSLRAANDAERGKIDAIVNAFCA